MISNPTKVSIILPTYNGAKYIKQSINSCLYQTYSNIELVIVDDGSTDETDKIVRSYRDKRIKYFRHEKNLSLPRALNTGFAKATGDYLTWTSDDNLYGKDAIGKMVDFLKNNKGSFVYCDYCNFKNDDVTSAEVVRLPKIFIPEKCNSIGPCFLYSRKVMEIIGNYDPATILAEDYDYWIRISKKFIMYHLDDPNLYFFRRHDDSLYVSKYYEVKITDFLVRFKNNVLDSKSIVNLFINLKTQRKGIFFNINKIINKILFWRKINKILVDYEVGKINFEIAKLKLRVLLEKR